MGVEVITSALPILPTVLVGAIITGTVLVLGCYKFTPKKTSTAILVGVLAVLPLLGALTSSLVLNRAADAETVANLKEHYGITNLAPIRQDSRIGAVPVGSYGALVGTYEALVTTKTGAQVYGLISTENSRLILLVANPDNPAEMIEAPRDN